MFERHQFAGRPRARAARALEGESGTGAARKKIMGNLSRSDRATVLVVDHDEQNLDAMARVLTSLGCRTIARRDGESALATLELDRSIDLLLTEIFLQGNLDGPELGRLANEANPRLAVVYSTSYSPMFLLDSEAPRDRPLVRKPWQRSLVDLVLSSVLPRA
jgi:CheY-like chemotaxis protein